MELFDEYGRRYEDADRQERGRDYVIPNIIYSDAYSSEMVAYADLILPDTTYLERHDCISLLDRPICEADGVADAIRWPVVEPDRDVRGFQSVLCELGARLNLPGFVNEDGSQKYKITPTTSPTTSAVPASGPWPGSARAKGLQGGRGDVNEARLTAISKNGGFWIEHVPRTALTINPSRWTIRIGPSRWASMTCVQPYIFQLYVEPMRKFQAAAEGIGTRQPPEHLRGQIKVTMDPLPIWYPPFEDGHVDPEEYPVHALTQRPMAMYHSWGTKTRGCARSTAITRSMSRPRFGKPTGSRMAIGRE